MNAIQIHVVQIVVVVKTMVNQHVSVFLNLKELHHIHHAVFQQDHVIHHLADQILNVPSWKMVLQNVHVLEVILKVQIQFVVVLNQKINVNQIHVVSVLFVIHHVTQFVTVQNQQ